MLNQMQMIRLFLVAAESSTFREAAIRLGTSPQTVTRAIKELEQKIGETLFHRSTRQVHLTAFGAEFAVKAQETLFSFDQLFLAHTNRDKNSIVGRVGITAPRAIGKLYLVRFLKPLLKQNPGLRIDLSLDDQITDVIASKIDIGVRIGEVRNRGYVARSTGHVPLHVVASPVLIKSTNVPISVERLKNLPLSVLIDINNGRPWPWLFAGEQAYFPPFPACSCDDPETELEIILAGLAFGQVPSYLAQRYLADGRLIEVLRESAPQPYEVIIYRTQAGSVAPRIKLVYDYLHSCFSNPDIFPQSKQ
ncbi:LysR family transcriptional regulator [Pseudomonas sp. RIT-PI-q]|uniref:LysR family transcriptional regulator n=1 Tax=Pseudomonas sp. RIT-PI-q TaxID=1690247 RepID=UPI0009EBE666|nr:LysR family transcriptional regulator [Pseudomonas sp. RIT-PI-q]